MKFSYFFVFIKQLLYTSLSLLIHKMVSFQGFNVCVFLSLAVWQVGSEFLNQGLNLCLLH